MRKTVSEMETSDLMAKRQSCGQNSKTVNKLTRRKRKNSCTGHLCMHGSHICLMTAPKT